MRKRRRGQRSIQALSRANDAPIAARSTDRVDTERSSSRESLEWGDRFLKRGRGHYRSSRVADTMANRMVDRVSQLKSHCQAGRQITLLRRRDPSESGEMERRASVESRQVAEIERLKQKSAAIQELCRNVKVRCSH